MSFQAREAEKLSHDKAHQNDRTAPWIFGSVGRSAGFVSFARAAALSVLGPLAGVGAASVRRVRLPVPNAANPNAPVLRKSRRERLDIISLISIIITPDSFM